MYTLHLVCDCSLIKFPISSYILLQFRVNKLCNCPLWGGSCTGEHTCFFFQVAGVRLSAPSGFPNHYWYPRFRSVYGAAKIVTWNIHNRFLHWSSMHISADSVF
jgi:hypothetical protein